jgi:hypothetical protein
MNFRFQCDRVGCSNPVTISDIDNMPTVMVCDECQRELARSLRDVLDDVPNGVDELLYDDSFVHEFVTQFIANDEKVDEPECMLIRERIREVMEER